MLLPRKSHKTPASLRASAHAGVAAPRLNVQLARAKPGTGVEGTR